MGNKITINEEIVDKKEQKCHDKYDDLLLCQREYGFNDLKYYYLKKYEKCIKKLDKMKTTLEEQIK